MTTTISMPTTRHQQGLSELDSLTDIFRERVLTT